MSRKAKKSFVELAELRIIVDTPNGKIEKLKKLVIDKSLVDLIKLK